MSNLWERFNGIASMEEVEKAKSQYINPEKGVYELTLVRLEPSESQAGLPMIKGAFKLGEGNDLVGYMQMLQNINMPTMTAVNIADGVKFLSGILGEEVEFKSVSGLADLILQMNHLDADGNAIELKEEFQKTYLVDISYGKKDTDNKYPKFKIIKCVVEEELPFK